MYSSILFLYFFISNVFNTNGEKDANDIDSEPYKTYPTGDVKTTVEPLLYVEDTPETDITNNFYVTHDDYLNLPNEFLTQNRLFLYTKRRYSNFFNQHCNDKSIWSSCVCQFTCVQPNIVDCYYPCVQGCECKSDFVYDSISKQCVFPEECHFMEEYILYNK